MGHQLAELSVSRGLRGIGAIAYYEKEMAADAIKVSFRSIGSEDVARLCQHFGGGGHEHAASCTVKLSAFDEWKRNAPALPLAAARK
jgi:nanoRNase/pAp phosphatase (c-di-AMP/oligoRNAs hydrolase)